MIDHSKCEHPRTSSARAKCRRQQAGDDSTPKRKRGGGSVKVIDLGSDGRPQTPRFKSDECHTCGVERIAYSGTDAWTSLPVLVGEKCLWRVRRADDFRVLVED